MSTEDRLSALAARHAELAEQHADVAELSAQVHEHAAKVHEQLADPLLDPQDLRDHAARDRETVELERRRAAESRDRT